MEQTTNKALLPAPTMQAKDVAAALRCSVSVFYNKRGKLEENGFPKKLPACNVWSRAAVMRWINSNGLTEPLAPEDNLANATADLERFFAL